MAEVPAAVEAEEGGSIKVVAMIKVMEAQNGW